MTHTGRRKACAALMPAISYRHSAASRGTLSSDRWRARSSSPARNGASSAVAGRTRNGSRGPLRQRRDLLAEAGPRRGHGQPLLVAELAVEVGDPGDDLHRVAEGGAPAVHLVHLAPDQPPAAVLRQRTHQLHPPHAEAHAGVAPRLGDQAQRRDDPPAGGVLHHREAAVGEGGVGSGEQVARPGGDGPVGPARRAEDSGVELGQLLRVRRRRAAQHQPAVEPLDHLCIHRHTSTPRPSSRDRDWGASLFHPLEVPPGLIPVRDRCGRKGVRGPV